MENVLSVKNLVVDIKTHKGVIHAVRGVSFDLRRGETLAVVGESGCGKSMTMKAVMQILPSSARITEGEVNFHDRNLAALSDRQMRQVRGADISMIFQDPMTSLNPTMRIGKQIDEILRLHRKDMGPAERKNRAVELLGLVGISNPETRYRQYPHQLSGGQRQRVGIAMALSCDPEVLIADEPTTALDVTIQAQILDLMRELQTKVQTSIIMITHNLGVVANIADRVAVMYGGKIVEEADVRDIFRNPCHEYTRALLQSIPGAHNEGRLRTIPGTPPDLMAPPSGCPFAARCHETMEVCRGYMPDFYDCGADHRAACWMMDARAKEVGNE